MKKFKLIIAAALLILAIIVVFQNTAVVETKLLFATISMPRALLLLLTLLIGVAIGLILSIRVPSRNKIDSPGK